MIWTTQAHRRARETALLFLLFAAAGSTGCTDPLDVSDPTAILDSDVNNAEGAELLRRAALRKLYDATGPAAWYSGLFADEFLYEQAAIWDQLGVLSAEEGLDRRSVEQQQAGSFVPSYSLWQELRLRRTSVALAKLRAYAMPGAREAHVGEMLAVRGYAALRLAEDFCPGFPLHDVVDYKMVYGPPLSTEQAFERALADFDSAAASAADSARVLNFARVGRARTLLNLGRFAEAAAAVTDVPTGYVYQTEYSASIDPTNPLASEPGWNGWGVERSVADREGGNGLDFVSARDPRVPTIQRGTARDGQTRLYGVGKYPSRTTPIVLASGLEAQLIQAEAALRADPNDPQWLIILNALRAASPDTALSNHPLTDPGADAARVDLLFRERAFWLFATGHRLGDLRRLLRQYSRTRESVFPIGAYWRGGNYGTGTSIPLHADEVQSSPGVTGCTSL